MSNFLKNNYEKFLMALGAFFLVVVALVFLWSVSFLSNIFGGIFNPDNNNNQAIRFDLEGARALNLNIGE